MPVRCLVSHAAAQAVLCSSVLIAAGCSSGSSAAPAAPPPPSVEVAPVIQRDTPIYNDWVAVLDGYVNAQIQPRVSGYIIKQNYSEGEAVRTGDVLFEIDPRPFMATLDQAKAQLAQAEAQLGKATLDVERDTPLAEARAIARSQLDTETQAKLGAQASVLAAKATVEQAQLDVEFTKVTSLVTGIAGIARVQIGNLVGPSSVLTSVSQVDPIKAYFTVSEQVFIDFRRRFPTEQSRLEQRKRMPLQLVLGDGSIYEHVGTISFADREINPATGTIRVAGVFPNPTNLLRPGGYGRVRLSVRTVTGALLTSTPYADAIAAAQNRKQEINLLNASLTYAMHNGMEFTVWGRNILNKRTILQIFDSPVQIGSISGYPSEPRTYGISARYRF